MLPDELAAKLDEFVEELGARLPGVPIDRETAARWLLESVLRRG